MKKIKFLHGFLVTLLVLNTLFFIAQIYNITMFEGEFEYSHYVLGQGVILISIIALFFLQRALYSIIKNGFFNKFAHTNFKWAGLFFLLTGFGSIILNVVIIVRNSYDILELLNSNLGQDLLLIMVGFSLFVIADVVQNGNILKTENDLTI
mgnify:CR=1 FL=1|tara:strand:- start:2 stop:454 length:453 start_codon:yes stop_codon:yes gene_type:complete